MERSDLFQLKSDVILFCLSFVYEYMVKVFRWKGALTVGGSGVILVSCTLLFLLHVCCVSLNIVCFVLIGVSFDAVCR